MSADTQTYTDGKLPILFSKTANGWKNENNFLIESAGIALNTGNNLQTTQAVTNYANGAKFLENIESVDENVYLLRCSDNLFSPTSYVNGQNFYFKTLFDNTDNPQIQIDGLKEIPLLNQQFDPLPANTILKEQFIWVFFLEEKNAFILYAFHLKNENYGVVSKGAQSLPREPTRLIFDNILNSKGIFIDVPNSLIFPSAFGFYNINVFLNIRGQGSPSGTFFASTIEAYTLSLLNGSNLLDTVGQQWTMFGGDITSLHLVNTRLIYNFSFLHNENSQGSYSLSISNGFSNVRTDIINNIRKNQISIKFLSEV